MACTPLPPVQKVSLRNYLYRKKGEKRKEKEKKTGKKKQKVINVSKK